MARLSNRPVIDPFTDSLELAFTWLLRTHRKSCSWLNAVEGFFTKLTRRRLKNGVFCSVVDLQAAINRFIKEHNQQP